MSTTLRLKTPDEKRHLKYYYVQLRIDFNIGDWLKPLESTRIGLVQDNSSRCDWLTYQEY